MEIPFLILAMTISAALLMALGGLVIVLGWSALKLWRHLKRRAP